MHSIILKNEVIFSEKRRSQFVQGRLSEFEESISKKYSLDHIKRRLSELLKIDINDISQIKGHEFDNGYGIMRGIDCCFKFSIGKINFDLVVTRYNPKDTIEAFDFSFNKVYYDGYNLIIDDKQSIINRNTYNEFATDRYNITAQYKFKENINRIDKYIKRGFMVFVGNSPGIEYDISSDNDDEICY